MFRNPFRKPPTRMELIQESVADTWDTIQHRLEPSIERLRDAGEHVGELAGAGLETAASAFHSAAEKIGDVAKGTTQAASHGAEAAQQKAHFLADFASEKAGDVKASARDKAADVADAAHDHFDAAHDKLDAARESAQKLRFGLGRKAANLADVAATRRDDALESAHDAAYNARSAAEKARSAAADAALSTQQAAREKAGLFSNWLGCKRETAMEHGEAVIEGAQQAAASTQENTRKQSKKARRQAEEAALASAALLESARRAADKRQRDFDKRDLAPVVHVEEKSSTLLWFALGLVVGAGVALLMAPSSGRRTRALIRDKAAKAKRDAERTASSTLKSVQSKARGAYLETVHTMKSDQEDVNATLDDGDDATIADRVRTTLGENDLTRNLPRLNVDCHEGIITLRGPIEDALESGIETLVRTIKGVRDVKMETRADSAS